MARRRAPRAARGRGAERLSDWPAWAAFEEDPGEAGSDLVNHWIRVYSALRSLLGSGGSVTVSRGDHTTQLTAAEVAERLEFWEGELRKREAR